MTEEDLHDAVLEARSRLKDPSLQAKRDQLGSMIEERDAINERILSLSAEIKAPVDAYDEARAALKAFYAAPPAPSRDDVAAAVQAIADAPPATPDRSYADEDGAEPPARRLVISGVHEVTEQQVREAMASERLANGRVNPWA